MSSASPRGALEAGVQPMRGWISWASLCALLLAAILVVATLRTIDFPLGTIGDEWGKIDAVRTDNNRYYHPLLMIEVTQVANLFAQARDLQSVVDVGRACAAFAGGLLVFATLWLARLVLPDLGALAAAAAEDIFIAPFLILALVGADQASAGSSSIPRDPARGLCGARRGSEIYRGSVLAICACSHPAHFRPR